MRDAGQIVTIKGIKDFSLLHILECGQCFRWEKETDGSYTVTA
jgi:N-glycosylase/DNA lyase